MFTMIPKFKTSLLAVAVLLAVTVNAPAAVTFSDAIAGSPAVTSPTSSTLVPLVVPGSPNATKKITIANLKTALNFQPLDSDLTAIAALSTQPFGIGILEKSSAANARTYLGLGTMATENATDYLTNIAASSSYQPLNSNLTSIAGLSTTTFGRGLLTETDASTARTTLGLVIGSDVLSPNGDGSGLTGSAANLSCHAADLSATVWDGFHPSVDGVARVLVANDGTTQVLDWSGASGAYILANRSIQAPNYNNVNITAPPGSATLTIADGKTLTASNTITLAGTDGSTLDIGTGGTLGTGAFAAAFNPAIPGAIGGTTPSTGAFTSLDVTGAATVGRGTAAAPALRVGPSGEKMGLYSSSPYYMSLVWNNAEVITINSGGFANFSGQLDLSNNLDCRIVRDAANAIAQRNSTNAQTLRIYNTYTDASNYERGILDWSTTGNVFTIGTQKAGTGSTRSINIDVGGTNVATFASTGMSTVGGINVGNLNVVGTATPTLINMDTSYGTNTAGKNLKLKVYSGGGGNDYGVGIAAGVLELVSGTGGAFKFYTDHATTPALVATIDANGIHTLRVYYSNGTNVMDAAGSGSPEGVLAAGVGSTYRRTDGGSGTAFYVKESGTASTGWVPK